MQENIKRIQTTNGITLMNAVNFEPEYDVQIKMSCMLEILATQTHLKQIHKSNRRTNQKYDDVKIILETFGKIDAWDNMSDPIY